MKVVEGFSFTRRTHTIHVVAVVDCKLLLTQPGMNKSDPQFLQVKTGQN